MPAFICSFVITCIPAPESTLPTVMLAAPTHKQPLMSPGSRSVAGLWTCAVARQRHPEGVGQACLHNTTLSQITPAGASPSCLLFLKTGTKPQAQARGHGRPPWPPASAAGVSPYALQFTQGRVHNKGELPDPTAQIPSVTARAIHAALQKPGACG